MSDFKKIEFFSPIDEYHDFKIAAAFVKWDQVDTPLEDPSFGTLKFIAKTWGVPGVDFMVEIESHFCGEDELNDVEGSIKNSTFHPLSAQSKTHVDEYRRRFKCLSNPEQDLKLKGNYDAIEAKNLMIVFDRCNNATSAVTCKSEEEIQEFMKFKYIVAMWN